MRLRTFIVTGTKTQEIRVRLRARDEDDAQEQFEATLHHHDLVEAGPVEIIADDIEEIGADEDTD